MGPAGTSTAASLLQDPLYSLIGDEDGTTQCIERGKRNYRKDISYKIDIILNILIFPMPPVRPPSRPEHQHQLDSYDGSGNWMKSSCAKQPQIRMGLAREIVSRERMENERKKICQIIKDEFKNGYKNLLKNKYLF